MAYQNVGTPRFYINVLQWMAVNSGQTYEHNVMTIPSTPKIFDYLDSISFPYRFGEQNFIFLLGHNAQIHGESYYSNDINNGGEVTTKVNWDADSSPAPEHNGWSLITFKLDGHNTMGFTSEHYASSIGALVIGEYYEMPHSPDLNLSLSYEYDGYKETTTKGGHTLTNSMYRRPAIWGDRGAWELWTGTPEDNKYFQPDVVNSWCWDTEYDYCQCDCSVYDNKKSCNTGYLEFNNTNCGPNCYCWGCNWV